MSNDRGTSVRVVPASSRRYVHMKCGFDRLVHERACYVVKSILRFHYGVDTRGRSGDFRWLSLLSVDDQGYFFASVDEAFGDALFNGFFTTELLEEVATVDGLTRYIVREIGKRQ